MKCPGCQHVISGAGAFCGYCGHKYSAEFQSELSLYLELKADLDKLRSIAKNDFAAGIERLSQKIEKRYGGEGKRAAPAPAKPLGNTINSPMVGTFYKAPSPESPAFVKEGDIIKEGQTVCIIEAMKLMNELKSEVKGKITKILVENGQAVEFGQPLFVVEPA